MYRNIFEGWHLVIIVLAIVLLFGWKKLPDAARSLGRSMRIFKAEVEEMRRDDAPSAASQDTVQGATVPRAADAGAAGAPAAPGAMGTTGATGATGDRPAAAHAETAEERSARLRAEAEAKIAAEDAERTRIEAELRAAREHHAAGGPADPTL